jgi:aspartokinase-like uncharacterized kinase
MPLVVLKLGGSLLSCRDLADRIRRLLARLAAARVVIVVGGGGAADVVRDWSRLFDLTEESGHWIALRSLSVTRALVKTLLPELVEVQAHQQALRVWKETSAPVLLDLESVLAKSEEDGATPLPHTWETTSDSIAAWIAREWDAAELILLKSIDLPPQTRLQVACDAEWVDANFRHLANPIPRIRWCNLAAPNPQIVPWLKGGQPDEGR